MTEKPEFEKQVKTVGELKQRETELWAALSIGQKLHIKLHIKHGADERASPPDDPYTRFITKGWVPLEAAKTAIKLACAKTLREADKVLFEKYGNVEQTKSELEQTKQNAEAKDREIQKLKDSVEIFKITANQQIDKVEALERELELAKQVGDAAGEQIALMNKEMLKLEKQVEAANKILNDLAKENEKRINSQLFNDSYEKRFDLEHRAMAYDIAFERGKEMGVSGVLERLWGTLKVTVTNENNKGEKQHGIPR